MSVRRGGKGRQRALFLLQRAMSASRRRVYAELLEDEYGNKVDARFLPHLSAKPGTVAPVSARAPPHHRAPSFAASAAA